LLSLKYIKNNLDLVKIKTRNQNTDIDFDKLYSLDLERRRLISISDDLKSKRNLISKKISSMKKNNEDPSELLKNIKNNSSSIKEFDDSIRSTNKKIENLLLYIPNLYHDSVPIGNSEDDNLLVKSWGELKKFDFNPKDHLMIGNDLNLFDFNRAAKMSGSGFPLYTGVGAKLERSLIQFMLDIHTEKHGYFELFPPFLTNRIATQTTGQLPKFEDDMYHIKSDDLFCISTAEVPVTNMHKDEILNESELPKKYVAYSACFRREAGSYGKDTRGLLRVHQFNKVEMVKFSHPDNSYDELESLRKNAEYILKLLKIPYRVINLCSGDLSFSAAKCYDIEIWAPGTKRWLEVSSCSNFESFQARRGNIKFRRSDTGKLDFVHTLNGSGLATPRLVAAILENYQNSDYSVNIPDVLKSYMKQDKITID
jgi:seryl-tRNA synthetase